MRLKKLSCAVVLAAAASFATGCIIDSSTVVQPTNGATNRAPIIAALDYSPKSAVGKNDTITFTVVANDLDGDALQYNWASTKGTLTGNSGQTVGWKPTRADGSFEPGLTTVTVIVSDGRQTTVGSVNIQIDAQGQATVSQTNVPSPAPTAAAPNPAATAAAPSDDGAVTGKVLWQDGFETGLDQWAIGSKYIDIDGSNSWNPLGWKTLTTGAQAGKFAAVLNNADETVKPDTNQPEIWIYSKKTIDLTGTVLPRVRLYFKSGADPATSVTYKVFFGVPSDSGSGIRDRLYVGGSFNGTADWQKKDLDLSTLKGKAGNIGVSLEVTRPTNEFKGPAIDSVTVYDAGQ